MPENFLNLQATTLLEEVLSCLLDNQAVKSAWEKMDDIERAQCRGRMMLFIRAFGQENASNVLGTFQEFHLKDPDYLRFQKFQQKVVTDYLA